MGQEFISQKVRRFMQCNEEFYPFIEKVLMRLPQDICFQGILDDSELEIVSFKPSKGFQHTFEKPIRSIIGLNESMLDDFKEDEEDKIVYGIVHEMAHKIIGKGKTGLLEMEAEDLLEKWGFEKESKKGQNKPVGWERKGYSRGYKWASKTKESLEYFERFFDEWNLNLGLTPERWDETQLLQANVIDQIHFGLGDLEALQDEDLDSEYYPKALIHGVMVAIKEKKHSTKGGEPD